MAKVIFSSDLQRYTEGAEVVEVAAANYRDLVAELNERFPDLKKDMIRKHSIAIDGVIFQTPLLETFKIDSELVFIAKIAGG